MLFAMNFEGKSTFKRKLKRFGSLALGYERKRGKKHIFCLIRVYRAFSHAVTAAILVFPNNETAVLLVFQTSPVGVDLFSYVKTFFCSN